MVYLFVLYDFGVVCRVCYWVVVMYYGEFVEVGDGE